jgi:hypothetical protein
MSKYSILKGTWLSNSNSIETSNLVSRLIQFFTFMWLLFLEINWNMTGNMQEKNIYLAILTKKLTSEYSLW